jgi:hypothetical protein
VNITAVRLLILLSSCALLWAGASFLRMSWGAPHAVAAGLVLVFLPYYLRLSVSIMVGLPAIALAMLSLLSICLWHHQGRTLWLTLSGLALALSVMTKVFTVIVAPLCIGGAIIQGWQIYRRTGFRRNLFLPAGVWIGGFGFGVLLLGLPLIPREGLSQLLLNHLKAQSAEFPDADSIVRYLRESLPAIFLGMIGSVHVIRRRRWTGLYLTAWAAMAFLLLSLISPVWYHHQLLVTTPVAALAGVTLGELFVAIRGRFREARLKSVSGGLHLVSGLLVPFLVASALTRSIDELDYRLPNFIRQPADERETQTLNLLLKIRDYESATHLVVTDRPMLAVRLGTSVPPEIAALTGKRLLTGELSEQEIISIIEDRQPELVALARFGLPKVDAYLQQHYRLVHKVTDHRLFVREDVRPESDESD